MTQPTPPPGTRARPRHLDPAIVAYENALEHGALVRIKTQTVTQGPGLLAGSQVLHFQYNPETITRTRQGAWDARKQRRPGSGAPQTTRTERGGMGSGAVNAESEQITLKLVFDATEAILAKQPGAGDGILPELAFLEITALGKESTTTTTPGAAARPGQRAQPVRPDELLLVLGGSRTFPVVITNLTITEQKFLPTLVPIRAEVDLRLTVLEAGESAYREWIQKAFADLVTQRQNRAEVARQHSALDAVTAALTQSLFRPRDDGAG